jgi:hypothetical protein
MFVMKNGPGTAYHSGAPEFTPVFSKVRVIYMCNVF